MNAIPEQRPDPAERLVEIQVNNKPVTVEGPRQTGREIKEAAITQGVKIQLSFQLSQFLGDHKSKIVGDDDEVAVHKGSRFVCVAGDDNS